MKYIPVNKLCVPRAQSEPKFNIMKDDKKQQIVTFQKQHSLSRQSIWINGVVVTV